MFNFYLGTRVEPYQIIFYSQQIEKFELLRYWNKKRHDKTRMIYVLLIVIFKIRLDNLPQNRK